MIETISDGKVFYNETFCVRIYLRQWQVTVKKNTKQFIRSFLGMELYHHDHISRLTENANEVLLKWLIFLTLQFQYHKKTKVLITLFLKIP